MKRALIAVAALAVAILACERATPTPQAPVPTEPGIVVVETVTPVPSVTEAPRATATQRQRIKITAGTLNCRAEASPGAEVLAVLPEGARYDVRATEGAWLQVRPAAGAKPCWIDGGYTE